MEKIIITVADSNYLDILKTYLSSLRHNGNDWPVYAVYANGTELDAAQLQAVYPSITIKGITVKRNQPQIDFMVELWSYRYKAIQDMIDAGYKQILAMDCDIIVRGALDGIWANVNPGVISFCLNESIALRGKVQGGVILFGNSPAMVDFHREILTNMGAMPGYWDYQIQMYNMLINDKYAEKIRYIPLEYKYNDDGEKNKRKDSIVWHVKHDYFGRFKAYETESAFYLHIAEQYING